jgi:hypothetical protein
MRVYARSFLMARAERTGIPIDHFVVRIANQCYACIHHSRVRSDGTCGHRCNSDVGPRSTSDYQISDRDLNSVR